MATSVQVLPVRHHASVMAESAVHWSGNVCPMDSATILLTTSTAAIAVRIGLGVDLARISAFTVALLSEHTVYK